MNIVYLIAIIISSVFTPILIYDAIIFYKVTKCIAKIGITLAVSSFLIGIIGLVCLLPVLLN